MAVWVSMILWNAHVSRMESFPMSFTVKPSCTGRQLVRASFPFPAGLAMDMTSHLAVTDGSSSTPAALRALTFHPDSNHVRRGMVTFVWDFASMDPVHLNLHIVERPVPLEESFARVEFDRETIRLVWPGEETIEVMPILPERSVLSDPVLECVEATPLFHWDRRRFEDKDWPVIMECRRDVLGGVVLVCHIMRNGTGDAWAPLLGWKVQGNGSAVLTGPTGEPAESGISVKDGEAWTVRLSHPSCVIEHPAAFNKRCGTVTLCSEKNSFVYEYLRCREEDKVPMQEKSWRRFEMVFVPAGQSGLTPALQASHQVLFDENPWEELYGVKSGPSLEETHPLGELLHYHREAIKASAAQGDDWGNVTAFHHGQTSGPSFGMNRLNHCVPIFEEAKRIHDPELLETALLWCDNMHDLSIWWGDKEKGGTRYNNVRAMGQTPLDEDHPYMWRSNSSVHFCTKGFASFLWAYEETGDPRMLEAMEAQVAYGSQYIKANEGECRNIGVAGDFMKLYRYTGENAHLNQALKLFRGLREKLSDGHLFSQGGQPIQKDPPFIDDDQKGSDHPFAKPYILGYALCGLPDLARHCPDEPDLREVVQSVADFLCHSQDPLGGWRYPHPASSHLILSQAMEHAWQIVQADRFLGAQEAHLDAVERSLRLRILGWQTTGQILSGLTAWELATGKYKNREDLYALYERPQDRKVWSDYEEGQILQGYSPPEGLVYLFDVLAFYLEHRSVDRLMRKPSIRDDPLWILLRRLEEDTSSVLIRSLNPDPLLLPDLQVWRRDEQILVACTFPNVPGFICDAWTYESDLDWVGADRAPGGALALTHRMKSSPHTLLITRVTPEIGAVTFEARVMSESKGSPPEWPVTPNLCWQLQRADGFRSKPEPYPEFVKRCFIFTQKGRTFLHETRRNLIPCREPDDIYNNPPWVQMYVGTWQDIPSVSSQSWSDYSPDKYTTTVIGSVSRNGKYLAAIANDTANVMCQAWHDCLHNNANWDPADAPVEQRRWKVKIYAMANEPEALLQRVSLDFPRIHAAMEPPSEPPVGERKEQEIVDLLPCFQEDLKRQMSFPLSWHSMNYEDFLDWQEVSRAKVTECLLAPLSPAPFCPEVVDREDRGTYVAEKMWLHLSAESRALSYLLRPKGTGPFPAVLLLHDHGARFDIGKEKLVRAFGVPDHVISSSEEWIEACYGGRYIGDELAKAGYVCFVTDALNWSDRGGAGYEGQQALGANLFHLGSSLAGRIAQEDLRAAEFLSSLPEVDSARVAAMGLSMGGFRTWQVTALSEHVCAGVSICWMATVKGLMVPGNNQARGQSSFTMLHPGLFNYMDYPDVASLACPKPMLFYAGEQDLLFPVPSVKDAYATMRRVWESQNASDRLETRIWDVPHCFNVKMQKEAFTWLDRMLADTDRP